MSNIIKTKELNVFTCLIIEKNNSTNDKNNQIIIILNTDDVKIYRLIKSNKENKEEKIVRKFLYFLLNKILYLKEK
jgi:hypothetical protein